MPISIKIRLSEAFRNKIRWLLLLLAAIVSISAYVANTDRTVMGRSRLVCRLPEMTVNHHRFYWLSNNRLLYTDYDKRSHILNISTGEKKSVPSLDTLSGGLVLRHGCLKLSPNRALFLRVDDDNRCVTVFTPGGVKVARWAVGNVSNAFWCPDSRRMLLLPADSEYGQCTHIQQCDVQQPGSISLIPFIPPTLLADANTVSTNQGLFTVEVPNPPGKGSVINIYNQSDATGGSPRCVALQGDVFEKSPSFIQASVSPSGKHILWIVETPNALFSCCLINSHWPYVRAESSGSRVELWCSDADGRSIIRLGHFPEHGGRADWPGDIEWLPDDSGISYEYDGSIYSCSIV